jgi:hypothetical protein
VRQKVKCWIEHRRPELKANVDYELSATCPICNLMNILKFADLGIAWSATCKHQRGLMLANNRHPQMIFEEK